MTREQRLKHALNNESASKALLNTGKFGDWVITTSFYACLHYVCFKIFPMTLEKDGEKPVVINTIDRYINFHALSKNKHRVICDLVYSNFPEIGPYYNSLMDQCHTARYRNYQVSERSIVSAMATVIRIKKHLQITDQAE